MTLGVTISVGEDETGKAWTFNENIDPSTPHANIGASLFPTDSIPFLNFCRSSSEICLSFAKIAPAHRTYFNTGPQHIKYLSLTRGMNPDVN